MDSGLLFALIGGLWEPVWVWFLDRSSKEAGNRRILCLALFLVTSVVSVYFVGLAMQSMNIGVAYAVWTAVGSITTMLLSRFALGESFNVRKVVAVVLIMTGIIGLHFCGGGL